MSRFAALAAVVGVATVVLLEWRLLVSAAVALGALRLLGRRAGITGGRRRRPRASWAKNIEAASLAYASWNTRHLVAAPRRSLRAELREVGRKLSGRREPCRGCGTTTASHAETCPRQWDDVTADDAMGA